MKKILIIGNVQLTEEQQDLLKKVLKCEEEIKYETKHLNTLIPKEITEYSAVVTLQNNPHVIKNMLKRMKGVPLFKLYKDKEGKVVGFMEIKNVTIKYDHEIHKLDK